jgi:hypothetical protein
VLQHKAGVRATAGTLKRYVPRALLMREDFSGVTAVTRCLIGGQDNIFSGILVRVQTSKPANQQLLVQH